MKYRFIVLIIILLFMNSSCAVLNKEVGKMTVSLEEAVEIANKELSKQNFDIAQKKITADEKNTLWDKYFLSDEKAKKANPEIFENLNNREYWAIYYSPKETGKILGGESWVFIDKKTGEIIELFYLK